MSMVVFLLLLTKPMAKALILWIRGCQFEILSL